MQYYDGIGWNELKTNWIKNHTRVIVPLFSSHISELWILVNISVVNIRSIAVKLCRINNHIRSLIYFCDIINYSSTYASDLINHYVHMYILIIIFSI